MPPTAVMVIYATVLISSPIKCNYHHDTHNFPNYHHDGHQLDNIGYNGHGHEQDNYAMGAPQAENNYQSPPPPTPSPGASSCLSRIRLAASFDPLISSQINRFIDSMRIDRLRAYVCERTAYFCDASQQKEVGDLFHQYDHSVEIIDNVKRQLSSTEKDNLNMMENLNDTLAEQAFYIYKFHQLNPADLGVLTSAKTSLTAALSENTPDASLSKAMGSFSQNDIERLSSLPISSLPEEVRGHLARCQITEPDVVHDAVAFLMSIIRSKQNA